MTYPVDRLGVEDVRRAELGQAHQGENADEDQNGKQNDGEPKERLSPAGRLDDKAQSDHGCREGREIRSGTPGGFGYDGASSPLQGEMLGGEELRHLLIRLLVQNTSSVPAWDGLDS